MMTDSMIISMIIPNLARVTVTLPQALVQEMDARTKNRSRFILVAVERELRRAARAELRRSLASPHPESAELAEAGLADWAASLPVDEAADLVDLRAGRRIRWISGRGWSGSQTGKER
jgi:hypothetical protein